MRTDSFVSLVYRTSLVGCLLGVAGTLYFLGGLAGYLANPAVNVVVGAALILAALFFIYHFVASAAESRAAFFLWLLILLILAAEVLLGLVPPTARDELTHHLVIPRLYVRAGRIIEIPFAPYSYYPMLLDMLYTPWVRWGWDSIPKLVHGLFGFLTGLLLYAYLARRMNSVYGMLGFFFFISTPIVLRLSNWAYVDLGVAFYSTASLVCLLFWAEAKQDRRWLIVAGLSAGFAAASKPNGLLALVLLSLLLALTLARDQQREAGGMIPALALFAAAAAAPFLPWLVKNGLQTGNPFFPLLGGFLEAGARVPAARVPAAASSESSRSGICSTARAGGRSRLCRCASSFSARTITRNISTER